MTKTNAYTTYCMTMQTFMHNYTPSELAEELIELFAETMDCQNSDFETEQCNSDGIVIHVRSRKSSISILTIKRNIVKAMKNLIRSEEGGEMMFASDFNVRHGEKFNIDDCINVDMISNLFDISVKNSCIYIEYDI